MKIFCSTISIILLVCISITLNAQVKTKWAVKGRSFVQYTMHHAVHEFSGKDTALNCIIAYDPVSLSIQKVSASANIADFNSGSGNRDSHAMEVLEAIKYPQVLFKCNKVEYKGTKLTLTGYLTFHGVTKEIKVMATEEKTHTEIKVKGSFKLIQEEYGIKRETFMMVPVDDHILIDFEIIFQL
jgi:polyisoprenoid-binding protein YceI